MKRCSTCGLEYPDDQKFCPKDGTALRSTTQASLVDSIVADRYHIVKKLGEGGMGAVYLGEHVKMGRKSAIKVMASSMASDPDAIARFNREAANAARITHPNVCAIYDFGETPDGIIYLAMEYIEGESLGDVLDREGVLAPARAVTILRQTADALQAAHDLGIVHRDLKPDNIMLARGRGGTEVVKVVDFGIAKAMTAEDQRVTKTGLVVGTPEYMSPEQLSGDVLDGRSDLYSLALVFYRMLTGTFPFPADNAQEMMIKRLTDEPLPLDAARPGVVHPLPLQGVMDRALARMPAERYPSAVQFAQEADAAAAGWDAAGAPAPDAATQLMRATEPSALRTARLTPTAVGPDVESTAPPPRGVTRGRPSTPVTPAPMRSPARPTDRKKRPALAIAAVVVLVGGGATAAYVVWSGKGDEVVPNGPPRLDTAVTVDTSRRGPGTTDSGRGGNGRADTGSRGTPNGRPPTINLAVISAELVQLGRDVLEAGTRAAAMTRLQELFASSDLPDTTRAIAASYLADGFEQQGDKTQACRWVEQAIARDPSKSSFVSQRDILLECPR